MSNEFEKGLYTGWMDCAENIQSEIDWMIKFPQVQSAEKVLESVRRTKNRFELKLNKLKREN